MLVRPDGHVAWRGDEAPGPADAAAIIDRVRGADSSAKPHGAERVGLGSGAPAGAG